MPGGDPNQNNNAVVPSVVTLENGTGGTIIVNWTALNASGQPVSLPTGVTGVNVLRRIVQTQSVASLIGSSSTSPFIDGDPTDGEPVEDPGMIDYSVQFLDSNSAPTGPVSTPVTIQFSPNP